MLKQYLLKSHKSRGNFSYLRQFHSYGLRVENNNRRKNSPHPQEAKVWRWSVHHGRPCCICRSKRSPAGSPESSSGSIVGHIARLGSSERTAGSIGRPAAMAVAEAATHRGIDVAVARHGTIAVVHRRVVVAVARVVPVVVVPVVAPVSIVVVVVAVARVVPIVVVPIVAPVSVVMVVAMSHRGIVSMSFGRVGPVEVVSSVVAAVSMAVATPEGYEHCGTMVEHPVHGVAVVDGESPATGTPGERAIKPSAGHVAVVLPGAEHEAQVAVAYFPPEAKHVGAGIYVEQVVEVDLIHCLIL